MPLRLENVDAVTPTLKPVKRGGTGASRYVLVPKDWPDGADIRLVLLAKPQT